MEVHVYSHWFEHLSKVLQSSRYGLSAYREVDYACETLSVSDLVCCSGPTHMRGGLVGQTETETEMGVM